MKKLALVVILLTSLSGRANAQLWVQDVLSEVGITKETVETVKNGLTQLKQLQTEVQQVQWLISLTTSLVHNPNLGTIMAVANLLGIESDIPINLYAVQSLLSGYGGSGGIQGAVGKLSTLGLVLNTTYNNDNLYTCTNQTFSCTQTNANMTSLTARKGMVGQMVQSIQNHIPVLEALRAKLAIASDPKDVADLQGQVSIEQAFINSQGAQMAGVNAMGEAQTRISAEQAKQSWMQGLDNFNVTVK